MKSNKAVNNKLRIEEYYDYSYDCFAGTAYKQVWLNDENLGIYHITSNGYLPKGKRKPLSEFHAILAVIDDRKRKVLKELELLDAARSEVFERQAEWNQTR